ncbi:MAG: hypothetical protein HYR84_07970 [Planctomycetes bacterium]|nr:hypothetical protein [Planctomycetota bacterium]
MKLLHQQVCIHAALRVNSSCSFVSFVDYCFLVVGIGEKCRNFLSFPLFDEAAALATRMELTRATSDRDFDALPDLRIENWLSSHTGEPTT